MLLDRGHRSLEVLEADGIPVSEFFQNAARMGPATARAYALIVNGALSHDGDPALARHVADAILKPDSRVPGWPRSTRTARAGSTPASRRHGRASGRRAGRHDTGHLRVVAADARSGCEDFEGR